MAVPGGGVKEDSFNVLDLAEYTKNRPWWRKVFAPSSGSSAEKYNVATQLVIGGVTGWCTGFIFQKVGKLAATAVGGGFFLLQIANHTGYIKVDWKLVERDVNKAKQQLKFHSSGNKMSPEVKSRVDEVRQLSQGVCRCLAGGTAENVIDSWAVYGSSIVKIQGGNACMTAKLERWQSYLCIFGTASMASRHDTSSPCVAANSLTLGKNMLGLWGKVSLQSDKKS
ncbi:FUN14 domain-containing protein 2 isoform X1 [Ciconia boyciana]|uniref:FUN14 domain-containing protein 2 isoform X1 n=1 Tax=Ciconia boyciana TaxID=52775 RepID=UPI003BA01EBD